MNRGAASLVALAFGLQAIIFAGPALAQADVEKIGEEAVIYGLPMVMLYGIMNEYAINRDSGQFKAPFNHIKNEPTVYTPADTAIVTPNSDTPYSWLWLDLRAEPVVLRVQKDEPTDPLQKANWLPAPDGPIYMVLRLYWPKEAVLDGAWLPPPIRRAN